MNKTMLIHGGWAVAVLAAFALGAKKSDPSTLGADDPTAAGKSRLSARSPDSGPQGPSSRRGDREATKRDSNAIGRFFGVADRNLDLLITQALRDPSQITRRLAFSKLLEAMTPENASTLREQLVALGSEPDQWRDFHYVWGAIDGKAAVAHALTSPEQDLGATMTGWAAANPAEALAMLANLPKHLEGQRDELTASVVAGLADTNRSIATDHVLRLAQEGYGRASGLMELVANETLRADGPEAASRWSDSLPDGPVKAAAMGKVADAYARKDPEAAARWVGNLAGETYAVKAVETTGGRWARTNPAAAVGWLESLPAGTGQTAGLRNSFDSWEDSNPAAAQEYLKSMPQSPQRDSSISGFATGYAWQNPQVAIDWAQTIADPALRERSLTQVGKIFYQQNPAGAAAWLENSELPDETRQKILPAGRRL
jgi:hypothetical protein